MAHDGMARAVFPVHTSLDGDIVFAISSRDGKQTKPAMSKSHLTDILGLMASDTLMVAIRESVMQSKTLPVC
jgi:L-aminopeptidase/D-esterase-like protein